jgi:hypothetical protein
MQDLEMMSVKTVTIYSRRYLNSSLLENWRVEEMKKKTETIIKVNSWNNSVRKALT